MNEARLPQTPPRVIDNARAALLVVAALGLLALAAMPLPITTQLLLSVSLLLPMLALRPLALRQGFFTPRGRFLRDLLIVLGLFVSTRYLLWRLFYTLPVEGVLDFSLGLLLYAGEVFAFAILLLGAFVSLRPMTRSIAPLPEDQTQWPSVDVLIPSYNESAELLETTLLGARNIDYPRAKLNIYLLDDGGTLEKRTQADPMRRREAEDRHLELRALCADLGVHYLTRERNHSAKAGNLNDALPKVHGELVLILDADHVPTRDFLRNTVGWFLRNPKLFLVQTPHFFLSPDPIEKNLGTFQRMPSEQEMFYTNIQRGLDFWNASFFCGSAAVLRRCYLDEVGGLAGETITEDAETALALHRRGYDSAYIWRPMIAGLQPETFTSFVTQRARWAQGMMQLFLLKNPLKPSQEAHGCSGMRWWQRVSYLNSMLFWWFPFVRVIFLFAPLAYLFFGLGIFKANFVELLSYMVPHLVVGLILIDYLYGNARWSFVSEFYETALSLYLIKPLVNVIRHPHAPRFAVTAKGEISGEDFISPLARPLYWTLMVTVVGILAGVWRLGFVPGSVVTDLVTLFWTSLNLLLLIGALGALLERQQRRLVPRIPFEASARLRCEQTWIACQAEDISVTGIGLRLDIRQRECFAGQTRSQVELLLPGEAPQSFAVEICDWRTEKDAVRLGCRFSALQMADKAAIVRLTYGDSERWRDMLQTRNQRVGVSYALKSLLRQMLVQGLRHLRFLIRHTTLQGMFQRGSFQRGRPVDVQSEEVLKRA
ncbi:UDP-forming cellulose synthase catalytic subunit [Rhabdochromatium marinum]|uniref:UDP-forming cellulose synthase catalytic subunit n=1 Tax=Rhabdochromatium marinum TaxID=48729 RepID=UPI0019051A00|nr:UDP-forming cellulose synthase catalytic subunit [Rhabdochromatium marinum]MBK1649240.1 cellulose synthase catalytic subunit (UDP-forming) [Rhabdochromatium marinum]